MATSYEETLAHCAMQDIYCQKLHTTLHNREASKSNKSNAQRLLGVPAGRILTSDVMIAALEADDQIRAEKPVPKPCDKALTQLRKEEKEWKGAATHRKKADYAAAIAAWEKKCARPGRRGKKPKKPKMPCPEPIPERFQESIQSAGRGGGGRGF
jgi:hypothetical protein